MALNQISTLLEKKGKQFIDNFLSEDLIITEKLDTYRILFEKQNDKLIFFKKDNTPINLIERTLTNIWEDAIIELNTIIGDTKIQEGLRFGISYLPLEKSIRIPYSKIPKYILTDITFRKNNKIIESYDYDEVTKWASIINLAKPPIIFSGKLNESQKETLINYSLRNFDNLKNDNFSEIIKSLFNKTYSNEKLIEGIIIESKRDIAQIISYEFDILNEAYQKADFTRDYYDIILLKLNNFLNTYNVPLIESNTSDEMYLELICDIFNKFCIKNPSILEGINNSYLNPPSFGYLGNLNLLLIKNKQTLNILEKGGKLYESLFKIILSSLRKHKKELGLLNENIITQFNSHINIIKNIINEDIQIEQNQIQTLLKESFINEIQSDNIVINALNQKMPTDINNMTIIASIQKAFDTTSLKVSKGKTKIVVYITDCQPFTTSQMDNINEIYKQWKCPVVIGSISNNKRVKGDKFHFSDNLIKSQLESVAIFNKELIPAYFLLDSWSLTEIFEYCRPNYEPIALVTDMGKKSEFVNQLYFEDEVMSGRICVERDFNIGELEIKNKTQAFRSIEDKMFNYFKDNVDKSIYGLFDSMVSEYKTWSGELKTQFDFQENKFK